MMMTIDDLNNGNESEELRDGRDGGDKDLERGTYRRARSERFLAYALNELPEYIEYIERVLEISRDIAVYDALISELKMRGVCDEDLAELLDGWL